MSDDNRYRNLKRGRPRFSGEFSSGKCDVRLTKEENNMLNELSERNGVSRSDIMRRALKDFHRFNTEE